MGITRMIKIRVDLVKSNEILHVSPRTCWQKMSYPFKCNLVDNFKVCRTLWQHGLLGGFTHTSLHCLDMAIIRDFNIWRIQPRVEGHGGVRQKIVHVCLWTYCLRVYQPKHSQDVQCLISWKHLAWDSSIGGSAPNEPGVVRLQGSARC